MVGNSKREPLRGALIAVIAAAIGAGGTLAGNSLAAVNARDQLRIQLEDEERVRQHDARRDAYQGLISVASEYQVDLLRVASEAIEEDRNSTPEENAEIAGDVAQLQSAWGEVQLVGSAQAADLAEDLRTTLNDYASGGNSNEELLDVANLPELVDFIDAAREELN